MSGWSELERGVDLDQFNLGADLSQAFPTPAFSDVRPGLDPETTSVSAFADETSSVFAESIFLPDRFVFMLSAA